MRSEGPIDELLQCPSTFGGQKVDVRSVINMSVRPSSVNVCKFRIITLKVYGIDYFAQILKRDNDYSHIQRFMKLSLVLTYLPVAGETVVNSSIPHIKTSENQHCSLR